MSSNAQILSARAIEKCTQYLCSRPPKFKRESAKASARTALSGSISDRPIIGESGCVTLLTVDSSVDSLAV
jgi:hypothetical protein